MAYYLDIITGALLDSPTFEPATSGNWQLIIPPYWTDSVTLTLREATRSWVLIYHGNRWNTKYDMVTTDQTREVVRVPDEVWHLAVAHQLFARLSETPTEYKHPSLGLVSQHFSRQQS